MQLEDEMLACHQKFSTVYRFKIHTKQLLWFSQHPTISTRRIFCETCSFISFTQKKRGSLILIERFLTSTKVAVAGFSLKKTSENLHIFSTRAMFITMFCEQIVLHPSFRTHASAILQW